MHPLVQDRIRSAQVALWRAELMRRGLFLSCIILVAVLAWLLIDQWLMHLGTAGRTLAMMGLLVGLVVYVFQSVVPVLRSTIAEDYAARSLERDHPELGHRLSSYVALHRPVALSDASLDPSAANTSEDRPTQSSPRGSLQDRVLRSVGADVAGRLQHVDALPTEATGLMNWWIATIVLFTALVAYAVASPKNSAQSVARLVAPLASIERPRRVTIDNVTPGDQEVLGGRTFRISAQVDGLRPGELVECRLIGGAGIEPIDESRILPSSALLETTSDSSRSNPARLADEISNGNATLNSQVRCQMVAATDSLVPDSTFELELEVDSTAVGKRRYQIVAGDASSREFTLTIRDAPVVTLERVEITPPRYTRESTTVSSSGAIRAIDGSLVTLKGRFNTSIRRGSLEFNPRPIGQTVQATAGVRELEIDADGLSFRQSFRLQTRNRGDGAIQIDSYRLRVWDKNKATNPEPVVYPVEILPDLPPEIVIVTPRQNPKDLPLDSGQILEIHATDPDFGLASLELVFRRGIDVVARKSLLEDPEGVTGPQVLRDSFQPSRMLLIPDARNRSTRLIPGDEIEITAVATDNRQIPNQPQVQPNVTKSDPIVIRIVAPDNPITEEQRRRSQNQGGGNQNQQNNQDGNSQSGGSSGGSGGAGEAKQSGDSQGQSGSGQGSSTKDPSDPNANSENDNSGSGNGGDAGPDNGDQEQKTGEDSQGGTPSTSGSESGSDPPSGDNGNDGANPGDSNDSNSPGEGSSDGSRQGEPSGESDASRSTEFSDGQGESGQNQQAPTDDGEAFERIQDFLEQQKKNGSGSESKPNDSTSDGRSSADSTQSDPSDSQQPNPNAPSDNSGKSNGTNATTDGTPDQEGSENGDTGSDGQPDGASEGTDERNENRNEQSGEESSQNSGQGQPESSDSPSMKQGEQDGSKSQSKQGQPSASGATSEDNSGDGSQSDSSSESQGQSGTESGQGQSEQNSESGDSDSGTGEENGSSEGSNHPAEQQPESGEGSQSSNEGDDASATSGEASESDAAGSSKPGSESQGDSGAQPQDTDNQNSESSQQNDNGSSTGGGLGSGGSGMGHEAETDNAKPPEPVDLEYTRRATDMVLDYLEQTRETPDPDLLDRLNWDAQTLERFRQRWANAPGIDDARGGESDISPELQEALRSLGMRPPTQSAESIRRRGATPERNGGFNDTGNRQTAPSSLRDAFEAFRRNVR